MDLDEMRVDQVANATPDSITQQIDYLCAVAAYASPPEIRQELSAGLTDLRLLIVAVSTQE